MSLYRGIGRPEYMTKRVPKNPKYQHVKARLDTGCSISKYLEKMEDLKKNYKYQKDEIFKRFKVTSFAQLILQVSSISDFRESDDGESHDPEDGLSVVSDADLESLAEHTGSSAHASPKDAMEICRSARSQLLSVLSGVGELNRDGSDHTTKTEMGISPESADMPYPDCPYLLLDVRDKDQYDRCHIISAHSFPIAMLSRTMNPYTREILQFKNAAGKIIIVYDEDERIASQVATAMCQRGFENLFMLSGGLKVVAQKFPEGMVTGSIPAACLPCPRSSKRKMSSAPSAMAEKRWRFTADELTKIQEQLEEVFVPSGSNSQMSSRMSTSSSLQSKASSARSRQSSYTAGSEGSRVQSCRPWK